MDLQACVAQTTYSYPRMRLGLSTWLASKNGPTCFLSWRSTTCVRSAGDMKPASSSRASRSISKNRPLCLRFFKTERLSAAWSKSFAAGLGSLPCKHVDRGAAQLLPLLLTGRILATLQCFEHQILCMCFSSLGSPSLLFGGSEIPFSGNH